MLVSACRDGAAWVDAVRTAVAGDFGPLDALCRPVLSSVARRIAPAWAEECVQAAMLKIWRRLGTVDLRREATVRRYLVTVGTRAMRDEHRRALAAREVAVEDVDRAGPVPEQPIGLSGRMTARCLKAMPRHGEPSAAMREVARKARITVYELERRVRAEIEACAAVLDIGLPPYLDDGQVLDAIRARSDRVTP